MANDLVLNGHDDGAFPTPSGDYAVFTIGGRELRVSPLSLWDLEQTKADFLGIGDQADLITQAVHVIRIVAFKLAPSPEAVSSLSEELMKKCSYKEYRELATSFNRLLEVSGFEFPPTEPDAARAEESLGTGTSTESPAN